MIRISYDRDANEFHMQTDEPPVSWRRSVENALMIIGGIVHMIRIEHGKAAAEGLLEMVRRRDEASVYSLEIEDGDAGEASEAEKDVDRSGGAGACRACEPGEGRGGGAQGDGQSGRTGA